MTSLPTSRLALKGLLLAASLWAPFAPAQDPLPTAGLVINNFRLTVEIPDNKAALRRGLMYRERLPRDRGMLFVWPEASRHGMWMLNTRIPLDVAFIDEDYTITNIERMEPETTEMHTAERPVRYALEVNAGWFEEHGVEAGNRVPAIGDIVEGIR